MWLSILNPITRLIIEYTMMQWLSKIIDRIFVVAGALLLLQAPLFMQEYHQQLAGRVAELHLQIEAMQKAATDSGKTLGQFVQKFVQSSDSDFSRQGQIMEKMVLRYQNLSGNLTALDLATVWARPFVFVQYLNYDVALSTLHGFSVGIPLTFEGIIFAFAGMLLGYGVFVFIRKCMRVIFYRREFV